LISVDILLSALQFLILRDYDLAFEFPFLAMTDFLKHQIDSSVYLYTFLYCHMVVTYRL